MVAKGFCNFDGITGMAKQKREKRNIARAVQAFQSTVCLQHGQPPDLQMLGHIHGCSQSTTLKGMKAQGICPS